MQFMVRGPFLHERIVVSIDTSVKGNVTEKKPPFSEKKRENKVQQETN